MISRYGINVQLYTHFLTEHEAFVLVLHFSSVNSLV